MSSKNKNACHSLKQAPPTLQKIFPTPNNFPSPLLFLRVFSQNKQTNKFKKI